MQNRKKYQAGEYKRKLLAVVPAICFFACCHAQSLLQYVQPYSGTASSTTPAAIKHSEAGSEKNANTIPAVGVPFAMTQWTAQTRLTENKCIPPYFYKDSLLSGFRGTHWLSGSCTQDYGSFTIMPVVGKLTTKVSDYAIPFSHADETTSPAYYKINLPASQLCTEISASLRCGIMQFTMQRDDSLYILVTPNSDKSKGFIKINAAKGEIYGYNPVHRIYQGWGKPAGFNGWFYIKVEKTIAGRGTFSAGEIFSTDSISGGKDIGAYVGFAMKKGEQLRIRIGTSFSSGEGAKKNLEAEIGSRSFNDVRKQAEANWENALSQVQVHTRNEKDKRVFYTAMYHAMQHPRLYNDVDGSYPRFAGNYELERTKAGQRYFDDFSMWDIYRAQLPLVEILQPQLVNEFIQSLVAKGKQGGWLPIFPCWNSYTAAMIGDHAAAFIAAAYNKGIRGFDAEAAWALIRKNAFEIPTIEEYKNGLGRRAIASYLQYGYIPMEDSVPDAFHKKEQVSRTLEYAYDDYAASTMARALNKTEEYKKLWLRSFNYENVLDKTVGMVRGRYSNGRWAESFNPDKRESYITEGTARQYTFYVPHNVAGLATMMGGGKALENSLDSLFMKNEYWHGNEPGHQIPFMYNYTASPWKTQREVRKLLSEEYSDGPGGLSGNDDAGQMSAWYVFASMGFYPLDPVSGEYILCSPLFDKIGIRLSEKKKFTINTNRSSASSAYISKVMWDGKLYTKNFITYKMIMSGGRLDIWLVDKPTQWGSRINSRPSGLTK
jgi:predicted alpha-1,2-mannosidase